MDGPFNAGRRALLRNLAYGPAAATLSSMLWGMPQAWADTGAGLPTMDPLVHFLRRTSFGIRPADLTAIRASGINAYLETQLGAAPLDDTADVAAKAGFPIAHLDAAAYWRTVYPNPSPPASGDFAGHWPMIAAQVVGNALYRALFSKRQLFEVMVDFWANHLNTFDPTFKGPEQQTVIRANALGNFRRMVEASQRDLAMSRYLNNGDSKAPTPNQNYARELLELHTLGEGRGYVQADVIELAKILSGHSWDQDRKSPTWGQYLYRPQWHVNGPKTLLGVTIAPTGQTEINQAFDVIFARTECAEFIAFKLCRHFVSDIPEKIAEIVPGDFVTRAAGVLRSSGYDISTVLRFILRSPEFAASQDAKFARPMESAVAMLRAYDVSPAEALPDSFNRALQELIDGTNHTFTIKQTTPPKNITLPYVQLPLQNGVVEHLATYLRNAGQVPGYWPT
ncbi:MAG TPA: DUF1800 domain-containing protein, partial [Candidatus Binatia bacterium]|nr:DUF1800 domain-containing protein [Candidatus Binatia bacterium]